MEKETVNVLLPDYLKNEIYGMQQVQKRLANARCSMGSAYHAEELQDILEELMRSHIELMSIAKQIIER